MWRLQKISIIPTVRKSIFFVEKYFESWDPKFYGPRNYLQIFYVAALIEECGIDNHYPLAMFRNGISKKTRLYYKVKTNYGTHLSSSDSEMASKVKKNLRSAFEIKRICIVILLKLMMMHCLGIGKKYLPLY